MTMPTIQCGVSDMPVVGLGTWQSDPGVVGTAVEHALNNNYKHIDCAAVYCNEVEVGAAFNKVFSAGKVKREEASITSKLWCTNQRPDKVGPACVKTLSDLQLDYLDLYLIHWPMHLHPEHEKGIFPLDAEGKAIPDPSNPSFGDVWAEMQKLVDEGKCKNIGLSNFNIEQIESIVTDCRIKPACLQVESHPQLPNLELLEYCKKNGIAFVAYSPLGNPGSKFRRPEQKNLFEDEVVKGIAEAHNVTPGQVLIRYQVDKGNAVIPKSVTPSRIVENLAVTGFSLTSDEVDKLSDISKAFPAPGYRTCGVKHFGGHPNYPFKSEL